MAESLVRVGPWLLEADDSERFRQSVKAGRLLTPEWWPLGATDLSDAWALCLAGSTVEEVPAEETAQKSKGEAMGDRSDWVHLDVAEILKRTDKALLLLLEDGEEVWMPLSQVADADDYDEGDAELTVSVTRWIAGQKGLI